MSENLHNNIIDELLFVNSSEKYERLQNEKVRDSIVNNVKIYSKLGAKFVYNITARELINCRIPIIDSIYRLIYRKIILLTLLLYIVYYNIILN